jgi:cardiolipin synthase
MALTPVLVVLVVTRELTWAFVVFVIAGVTDVLDGLIARRGHQRTELGALLDPVADKLLLGACYVALTWTTGLHTKIPVWLTVITLSRDVMIVISVAIVNITFGHRVFPPSLLGKLSTASQVLTAGVVLLVNCLRESPDELVYLFVATAVLTIVSALHYVYAGSALERTAEVDGR